MRGSQRSTRQRRYTCSDPIARDIAAARAGMLIVLIVACSTPVDAASTNTSFIARMIIQPVCSIGTNPLPFPQYSGAPDTATSTLTITCTNNTIYNVGLNPGAAQGATVTARKMTSGTNTINYGLFSDSGHSVNWGQTLGTDTVAGTGNGAAQTLTVYGLIPGAQIAVPATYNDTIVATVTY